MQTLLSVHPTVDLFLAQYRAQEEARQLSEPSWLATQRREAIQRFQDTGFPTTREEDWRYTDVGPILQTNFQFGSPAPMHSDLGPLPVGWDGSPAARLVFVNGEFNSDLSTISQLPTGTVAGSLRSLLTKAGTSDLLRVYLNRTLKQRGGFELLNSALWNDGACILIPKGVTLEAPIHIVQIAMADSGASVSQPRALLVFERESRATVVETFHCAGDGVNFANSVTEVVAAEDSVVDVYRSVHGTARSFHIGLLQMYASRGAQVSAFSASLGGGLVRNEVYALLDAEGADCTLHGIYAAKGLEHVDSHTTIDHAKPHGSSRQLYNGILDGRATGVFNGRVIVRPDAQKTDALQKNRNLLLSEDATIDTKPQLEISANDVRCTHGATVGQLDPEALFFLRSRGLDQETAVSMLVQAFASEVLDTVKVADYREWLAGELRRNYLSSTGGAR